MRYYLYIIEDENVILYWTGGEHWARHIGAALSVPEHQARVLLQAYPRAQLMDASPC